MEVTIKELQEWIPGAVATGDAICRGLSTDSRKVDAGNLFIALCGEHFDAHDFVHAVADAGAAAVVVSRPIEGLAIPALIVPDTLQALIAIAQHWRRKFSLPVIAVTGSNGKTTVKEMIASIFSVVFGPDAFLATSGNLNNEIGVPITVLRLNSHHRAAVIELGMNHPGEIAVLASVAQATVALVNNAQREHQEFMESVAAVAAENGSAIRTLPVGGTAVFPLDDEFSETWLSYSKEVADCKVISFGLTRNAKVNANYDLLSFGSRLHVQIGDASIDVNLHAAGIHNIKNALAAAACCHAVGIPIEKIRMGLEAFEPVKGRLQRKLAGNGAVIIDDTYNANPDSVRAAIEVLAQSSADSILVLGDMGEVGDDGRAFHIEVGAYAAQKKIKQLFALGELAKDAVFAFGSGAHHFDDAQSLCQALVPCVTPATTVLVKGSRFMKMERVVLQLTQLTESI